MKANEMTRLGVFIAFQRKLGGRIKKLEIEKPSKFQDMRALTRIRDPRPEEFLEVGASLGMSQIGDDMWPIRNFGGELEYHLKYEDLGDCVDVVLSVGNYEGLLSIHVI